MQMKTVAAAKLQVAPRSQALMYALPAFGWDLPTLGQPPGQKCSLPWNQQKVSPLRNEQGTHSSSRSPHCPFCVSQCTYSGHSKTTNKQKSKQPLLTLLVALRTTVELWVTERGRCQATLLRVCKLGALVIIKYNRSLTSRAYGLPRCIKRQNHEQSHVWCQIKMSLRMWKAGEKDH